MEKSQEAAIPGGAVLQMIATMMMKPVLQAMDATAYLLQYEAIDLHLLVSYCWHAHQGFIAWADISC